jgi:hypothetical protein
MSDWSAETRRIAVAVRDYIRIARETGKSRYTPDWLPTDADIDHSALLRRLLNGEKIYKIPPPNRYSYPWYELIDNGQFVWNHNISREFFEPDQEISEWSPWKRLENGQYTFYGTDRWEVREVSLDEKIPTGGKRLNDDGTVTPIYATRLLVRVDEEDIW